MKKLKDKFKSVRFRLFIVLCVVIMFLVMCLVAINSLILGNFYIYSKTNTIKEVFAAIDNYYTEPNLDIDLDEELKKISFRNNFDILIRTDSNLILFSTDRNFWANLNMIENNKEYIENEKNIIFKNEKMTIRNIEDSNSTLNYILLTGELTNGYKLYIRLPIAPIEENVRISNNALLIIGFLTILVAAFIVSFISRKFTTPILQLNDITKKMANLDFNQKYRISDSDDEINELGKNINKMSDKLETTINQLIENNIEIEKDIEEKSKIDEMRKQFISDVSHELKTPIALIQGYSEGLLENVNSDEESRKFYAEVILDETNKMDRLVKQLLELMKLEYGKREFEDKKFNIVELEKEVVLKSQVMLEEKNMEIKWKTTEEINVFADEFYIEQVISNYITNAIKHLTEVEGEKYILIQNEVDVEKNKVRIKVFNTGENIEEENITRIWNRFYKVDESRNRDDGGTGIGLSFVKAIMNNYGNIYGVNNKENGVEFYFELDLNIW